MKFTIDKTLVEPGSPIYLAKYIGLPGRTNWQPGPTNTFYRVIARSPPRFRRPYSRSFLQRIQLFINYRQRQRGYLMYSNHVFACSCLYKNYYYHYLYYCLSPISSFSICCGFAQSVVQQIYNKSWTDRNSAIRTLLQ